MHQDATDFVLQGIGRTQHDPGERCCFC
jgi:hypothetical protein